MAYIINRNGDCFQSIKCMKIVALQPRPKYSHPPFPPPSPQVFLLFVTYIE